MLGLGLFGIEEAYSVAEGGNANWDLNLKLQVCMGRI